MIAWLWARTVKSPNPAFAQAEVPLVSTFMLSTKQGKEAYVEPVIGADGYRYRFTVKVGAPPDAAAARAGTGAGKRQAFRCLISGVPITYDYIRSEGQGRRMGARLLAIVAEGDRGRVYLTPTAEHEEIAGKARPEWQPEVRLEGKTRVSVPNYGMDTFGDLFTARQLVALNTCSDLVVEARERIRQDAVAAGMPDDKRPLYAGGRQATAYGEGVGTYLAFAQSKAANRNTSLCFWEHRMDRLVATFGRQALPMVWDFAETNPLAGAGGDFFGAVESVGEVIEKQFNSSSTARVLHADAVTQTLSGDKIISTDPPYYDNICYADLSDFFYVWLRRSLRSVFPDLFSTIVVPKTDELIAAPYRHRTRDRAEAFFMDGMKRALRKLACQLLTDFPATIYYAFKQAEKKGATGIGSTGWETFLEAVIDAGFAITGTWPMRTEQPKGLRAFQQNSLASSIILVCRRRPGDAPLAARRDLIDALKDELPAALARLQRGNVAPVDLAQAAIGPGMAIFTRYAKVLHGAGNRVTVGEALALINQTLDEILAAQEGDFDTDSRWALAWFDQHGFDAGEYGSAETLATAKNTSVRGMVQAGIIHSQAGSVRLLRPQELPADWDPAADDRLTTWEAVHHLIRVVWQGGEMAAARLLRRLGGVADLARELCYRLYTVSERRKRAAEALDYNGLVKSWPEISRLAVTEARLRQTELSLNVDPGAAGDERRGAT